MRLALTPDGKWEVPAAELVHAAGAVGFTAVGINADKVEEAAVEAYSIAGVHCHELLAFIVGDDEEAMMADAEQLAERARTIGAEWVLTVLTDKVPHRCIERCARLFDDVGAGMAVEYTPLGAIPTIRDGMEFVKAANRSARAGLLIDSWHFWLSEDTWGDESLHRRAVPGQGVVELHRFAATLLDRGFDGTVSVEVLSAQLRRLPVDRIVERLYATTSGYWGQSWDASSTVE